MSTKEKHLYYLTELKDYKVNHKDPDIRGWALKDLDNRVIGKVDNLLVNKELGKVVYVDVEVDDSIIDINHDPYSSTNSEFREYINKEGENHIIIPIGFVDLNLDSKVVFTESINYQTFAETKRYKSGTHISREYEHQVMDSYKRRNRPENEEELRRTKTAYSDADLEERELKRKEELRHNEQLHSHDNSSSMEEKIRREKENLKYRSEDRDRPIDDHNRVAHHHDHSNKLHPDRTIDEDTNWIKDDRRLEDDDNYDSKSRRNETDEEFYNRKEFYRD